jgi:hypothetical protein
VSDIRVVIGGLFFVYGVILIVAGAVGEAVNLWTGLVMAVFGGAFLLWARFRKI